MRNMFGWESINDLVDKDISVYSIPEPESQEFSYQGEADLSIPVPIPEGYTRMQEIDQYITGMNTSLPDKWWDTSFLPVPIEETGDSIYFDMETIKTLQTYQSEGTPHTTFEMPPTILQCNTPEKCFMLTSFSLNYTETNIEDTHLSFKGYLFYQK